MNNTEPQLSKCDLQHKITINEKRSTALANDWLRDNGIHENQIHTDIPQVLQAQRLATNTLSNYRKLLGPNEGQTLSNFINKASNPKARKNLTLGQCFTVMNIAKDAQRKYAKKLKAQQKQHTPAH